jgi:hypothetical protein
MATLNIQPGETNLRTIVAAIRALIAGGSNAVGVVTLAPSANSTAVSAVNCSPGAAVFLFPTTAHAAAEVAAGGLYVPQATVVGGQFVIQHANNSQVDRTFFYVTLG